LTPSTNKNHVKSLSIESLRRVEQRAKDIRKQNNKKTRKKGGEASRESKEKERLGPHESFSQNSNLLDITPSSRYNIIDD